MTITDINTSLYQKVGDDMYRINLQTTAGQVKTADGSDVETRLAGLGADEILALGEEVDALKALGAELGDTLNTMSAAVSAARDAADAAASAAGGLGERLEELEAARPGIWARVDGLEERVDELEKPFAPPAEDEDGKKGLVPAPGAMDMAAAADRFLGADAKWHNRYLAPDYFNSVSLYAILSRVGTSTLSYSGEFTVPENGYVSLEFGFGKGDLGNDIRTGQVVVMDKNAPQGTPAFMSLIHQYYTYAGGSEVIFKPVHKNAKYTVTASKSSVQDNLTLFITFMPHKEAD